MLKKSRFLAMIAAIACISFSCTSTKPEPEEETVSQVITATVESDGSSAVWSTSDQLGVYTDASEKNVKYTNSASNNAAQASFKASTEVKPKLLRQQ